MFEDWGLGFEVWSLGFGVWGSEFGVRGFRVIGPRVGILLKEGLVEKSLRV